jgi:hypothetical protein
MIETVHDEPGGGVKFTNDLCYGTKGVKPITIKGRITKKGVAVCVAKRCTLHRPFLQSLSQLITGKDSPPNHSSLIIVPVQQD